MDNLKSFRILITNDDGIHAKGIKLLEEIALQLTDDVWIVAPPEQRSATGNSLTYANPLHMRKLSERHYTVNGTPTDCVIIGLRGLLKDKAPDLVLSGVNNGENIGESITHSGTIGAAMEATLHGVKAIALSQVSMEAYPTDWTVTKEYGVMVLKKLLAQTWPHNTLLNVNFPHVKNGKVKGIKVLRHGRRSQLGGMVEGINPRGQPYYWVGVLHNEMNPPEDTDLWGAIHGYITVTPINMDLTNYSALGELESEINQDFVEDVQIK